jgi:nucleoid DNA-binding protein
MNVPFLPDPRSADPLRRIVQTVAARTGLSPQHAATIVSHFLEAVTDEVSKGRAVSMPGFGALFPVARSACARGTKTKVTQTVVRFSAARGFREQVRHGAPPSETGRRRYVRHMRNHALGGPESRCSERTFTAARAFRDAIASQLGGEVSFD